MKRALFTLSFPRKWESSILFVILFALFFNTKTAAQIDTTTNVGGWRVIEYHNVSSVVIFQDTSKGYDLRSRGYVEGKGSLRLQFVSSKPNTQTAQAGLTISRTFTKQFQFPLQIGFAYKFGFFGPPMEYSEHAQFLPVLIGQSGTRYSLLNTWTGILGTTGNGGWIEDPQFAQMLDGRDSLPNDSIVGMEIGIIINVERCDLNLDWLAVKYDHAANYGTTVDSFEGDLVGVEGETNSSIPETFSLAQNYPNPFNPTTTITYSLSKSDFDNVSLKVYDLLGREVAILVNEEKPAGKYSVQFDASSLASGIYFYRLDVGHGQFSQTKKMILVK
ncbi:MAG: T9SS type A sorting domain-containing protein [Candidatus Paceibacterota bacterium]|jgi:hypothetical protein